MPSSSKLRLRRQQRAEAAAIAVSDALCASCGAPTSTQAGKWQLVRHTKGGPLHCAACWGDYEGELPATTPPTIHAWWYSPAAQEWLTAVTFRETVFEVAGESFVALTDPDNRHFFGVGADKVWPVSKRLTKFLAESHAELLPTASALVVEIGAGACPLPGLSLIHI